MAHSHDQSEEPPSDNETMAVPSVSAPTGNGTASRAKPASRVEHPGVVPDPPGAPILNGRYRVERQLARGGMAEVYLGQDLVLQRVVALKVLAGDLSRDPGFVERFRREARAAASLSHPNIVAVYDWGEADGSYYIVMEYVAGQTLAQLLNSAGPPPIETTVGIGADIAAALGAAHRLGMVHRDVKPGNVLIDPNGAVKVADFGIARATQASAETALTQTGTVLGTAAYLSPEQAEGRQADAKSDLYALGVVLYEMATGRPPFQGDTPVSVVYQHARTQPVPPQDVNPAIPTWLQRIILRAMAKDPNARYASADDMRADLLGGANGSPTSTIPMPVLVAATGATAVQHAVPAPTTAARRKNRWAWWAAAAIVAAAVIALVAYVLASGTSNSPAASGNAPTTAAPPSSGPTTTTSAPTTTTTTLPTSFAGYAIVAGSGTGALYCPSGAALGAAGQTGPSGNGTPTSTPGGGGQGGAAGCGSNGGSGGHGGNGAPGGPGGTAGNGGNGGCPPANLTQMRAHDDPCNGTGSDGGNGGNGGNGAPGETGGSGGVGGNGGNTERARGGNGGNGGDATHMSAGTPGGAGQQGGGPSGTEAGVNGQNGTDGKHAAKGPGPAGASWFVGPVKELVRAAMPT